ncbi:hypothetical protein [Algivirga pacifica]|uniref:DUF4377 domain-containing protein n=1 Tax=Algivirga pacifica TaxID=1162670 RepID=A0ABP9DKC2_9BACT
MFKYFSQYIAILFLLGILDSCMSEFYTEVLPDKEEVITSDSELIPLLQQMAENDGSVDDILDESSCLMMVFPVTITFEEEDNQDGQEEDKIEQDVTIYSLQELTEYQEILEEKDWELTYPFEVVLPNYNVVEVKNENGFSGLQNTCNRGRKHCFDFVYPITVSSYAIEQEQSEVTVIESKKELYLLLEGLSEEVYLTFNYPLSLVQEDKENIVEVNTQKSLYDILRKNKCD